ncbi:plasmid mobilization protein [Clostridium cellulovorans]|uniref:Mobilization protein n=1 Tax=Clostridium cellulovorans (strain ATCC 35296 / DSM 3052 / OCM 3 / 743B) TaxID=573061 RepID=D9SPS7_CLOC7|nr:plasmid mobilization relaxosome protein MobC [Clostridium cellulovorans]ADL52063.1 mobilization protein [Clostridium cellulovorans 743B]
MRTRSVQTNIRMTEEEASKIKDKAQTANMTFSNYIIYSALDKEIIVIDGVKEFTHQLSKVGANLNQITTLCHQGKITCVDINSTNKILADLWQFLVKLRKKGKKAR